MSQTTRRRSTGFVGALVTAFLVVAGAIVAPTAATAATGVQEGTVADATLDWGVKASFRNYIYNFTMFEGRTTLLGNATQPVEKGEYSWSGGAGTANTDGSAADISYGAGNGVHFQSHPMTVDGERVYALDMTFTNPHIVFTSPTTGELRMDVEGYEFKSMTEVGAPYSLTDAAIASLDLSSGVTVADGTITGANIPATLTAEGSIAFGGFYAAGDALDPVTFSAPVTPPPAPEPTISAAVTEASTTGLKGSATVENIEIGDSAGVYIGIIEKDRVSEYGSNASAGAQQIYIRKASIVDGAATAAIDLPAAKLDRTKEYVAVTWRAHGFLTDSSFLAQTDLPVSQEQWDQVFPPVVTETTLTAAPAQIHSGDETTLTATVTPAEAVGSVQFKNGDANLGDAVPVTDGKAVLKTSALTEGSNSITAQFVPENRDDFAASTSAAANVSVFGATTISASVTEASTAGLKVSATVENIVLRAGADVPDSGKDDQGVYIGIIEKDRVSEYGSNAAAGAKEDFAYKMFIADGKVTRNIDVPAAKLDRTKQYVAVTWLAHGFLNDSRYLAQTDLSVSQEQWDQVFPPVVTETTLTATPASGAYGDEIELSARVTPADAIGSVAFFDGDTQIGQPSPVLAGTAVLKTKDLATGSHSLTAKFVPTNRDDFAASESAAQTVEIAAKATTTTLTVDPDEVAFGGTAKLTAEVAPATDGTVTFKNGAADLGSPVTVVAGKAELEVALPAGNNAITAVFTPASANFVGSVSNTASVNVTPGATALVLTSSAAQVQEFDEFSLTATVAPAVDGKVTFTRNGETLGDVTVRNGSATFQTSESQVGEPAFGAVFTPANPAEYHSATAADVTVVVNLATPTATVNPGGSNTVTFGDKVELVAGPFDPSVTHVRIVVNSDPIDLGVFEVNDRWVRTTLDWSKLPADFSGVHTVTFTPVNADGSPIDGAETISATITIEPKSSNGGEGGNTTPGKQGGQTGLSNTGDDSMAGLAIAGVLALAAGAGLMLVRRRQRA